MGLVAVRCPEFWETSMDEKHKIWYSGKETNHKLCVGCLIKRNGLKPLLAELSFPADCFSFTSLLGITMLPLSMLTL